MDELVKYLEVQGGQGDQLGAGEFVFAMMFCIVCITTVCLVYRFTHKSSSYSQAYVHNLMLTGMVTTLIMIVIGSNIARAFSLVGALSIIRFRNAVKETRDVGYIFFVISIAMACGTRFYALAAVATCVISSVMIMMHVFNFGQGQKKLAKLLTIQMPPGNDPEEMLQPILTNLFESFRLVSVETVRQGLYTELYYSVLPKSNIIGSEVIQKISEVNNNLKVAYNYSAHLDDL